MHINTHSRLAESVLCIFLINIAHAHRSTWQLCCRSIYTTYNRTTLCFAVDGTKLPNDIIYTHPLDLSVYQSLANGLYNNIMVRGAPWSAANRLHGQRTGAFSWRPVLGLSRKTDQFRLDPTQNCAPGLWCDRESSVYHLALEMYSGIF